MVDTGNWLKPPERLGLSHTYNYFHTCSPLPTDLDKRVFNCGKIYLRYIYHENDHLNLFWVCNSAILNIFTLLCNHQHYPPPTFPNIKPMWSSNSTPVCLAKENKNTNSNRYLQPSMHSCIIYNSHAVEATLVSISREWGGWHHAWEN